MTYVYECFGDTLEFAETLGWKEPEELTDLQGDDYTPDAADALEGSATDYIEEKGYTIDYGED